MLAPFDLADLVRGLTRIPGRCPNCERDSAFQLHSRETAWPTWAGYGSVNPSLYPRGDLEIWQCLYCDRTTTLLVVYRDGSGDPSTIEAVYAWPRYVPRELPASTPDPARSLFREASIAAGVGARRAAAGACRAAVEAIIKERGAEGKDLQARINSLAGLGVDADTVRDLHEARLTGNWSMHEGTEFSDDELEDIADLIYAAAHELYEEPTRREAMREARAARRAGS